LKKIEKSIYIRNVDGISNKKGLIEHIIVVNIRNTEKEQK